MLAKIHTKTAKTIKINMAPGYREGFIGCPFHRLFPIFYAPKQDPFISFAESNSVIPTTL
jgi:hypothetical protein